MDSFIIDKDSCGRVGVFIFAEKRQFVIKEVMKNMQKITIWFLPIIVIAGLFYPFLGYLAVAMMAFLLRCLFLKAVTGAGTCAQGGLFWTLPCLKLAAKNQCQKFF